MNAVDCMDRLIKANFMMGDACRLNEIITTVSFDRDDLRVYMYYGTDEKYYGNFEMILFDISEKWYTNIAATFTKSDCSYKNIDKERFMNIVCDTTSKGDILKKLHNYEMNRLLEKL